MKHLFIIALALLLISCATSRHVMDKNNKALLSLEIGMSKQQVLEVMGDPDLNEAYKSLHGKSVAIFFYYTERKSRDHVIIKDETTPVVFEKGELIGWGSEFYEVKQKIEMDINIK